MVFLVLTCFVGRLGTGLQLFFARLQIMACIESIVGDDSAPPVVPVFAADLLIPVQQPFSAKEFYFIPKGASSPVWKIGFRCRKDQDYKTDKSLVFCTHDKCKSSGNYPSGHQKEFPVFKRWKTGQSNQIMKVHCNLAHKDEFHAIIVREDTTVAKMCYRKKHLLLQHSFLLASSAC